jgi:uncharacterized protein with HEPN domain
LKNDRIYLTHISESIENIMEYTADGKDAFFADKRTRDAVIRNFEIIGEAAKRISETTKKQSPSIHWRTVAGLRDVLIHNYMGVDWNEIWNITTADLPKLRSAIRELLDKK